MALCEYGGMAITTTQRVIKIGKSLGIKLPARELSRLGVKEGDEIQLVIDVPAKPNGT